MAGRATLNITHADHLRPGLHRRSLSAIHRMAHHCSPGSAGNSLGFVIRPVVNNHHEVHTRKRIRCAHSTPHVLLLVLRGHDHRDLTDFTHGISV